MFPLLVVCSVALPALELWVLWQVAAVVGWPLALAALVATTVCGVVLLRRRGVVALRRLRGASRQHRVPGPALVDEALGEAAAVALATPGFVTAVLGAALCVPPVRAAAGRLVSWSMRRRAEAGRAPRVRDPRPERGGVPTSAAPPPVPFSDVTDFISVTEADIAYGGEAVDVVDAAGGVTAVVEASVYEELVADSGDDNVADAWATFGDDRPWESEPRRFGRRKRRRRSGGHGADDDGATGSTTGAGAHD